MPYGTIEDVQRHISRQFWQPGVVEPPTAGEVMGRIEDESHALDMALADWYSVPLPPGARERGSAVEIVALLVAAWVWRWVMQAQEDPSDYAATLERQADARLERLLAAARDASADSRPAGETPAPFFAASSRRW